MEDNLTRLRGIAKEAARDRQTNTEMQRQDNFQLAWIAAKSNCKQHFLPTKGREPGFRGVGWVLFSFSAGPSKHLHVPFTTLPALFPTQANKLSLSHQQKAMIEHSVFVLHIWVRLEGLTYQALQQSTKSQALPEH
uniref:Uncharacterized protein n=1 Tax=Podarcis muralis TaxID=64176 RepID=A0A670HPJ9_PODMU